MNTSIVIQSYEEHTKVYHEKNLKFDFFFQKMNEGFRNIIIINMFILDTEIINNS